MQTERLLSTHAQIHTRTLSFIGGMWKRSLCIKYTRHGRRVEGEKLYSGEDVRKFWRRAEILIPPHEYVGPHEARPLA